MHLHFLLANLTNIIAPSSECFAILEITYTVHHNGNREVTLLFVAISIFVAVMCHVPLSFCTYTHVRMPMYLCPFYARIRYINVHNCRSSLESYLHLQARFFPFPQCSLALLRERKRNKTEKESFRLRYFRVNAAPGFNKPTICVEDYLICYVFLTNHKHPLGVEMAEERKGYSREPLCRPSCREQWWQHENFVNLT